MKLTPYTRDDPLPMPMIRGVVELNDFVTESHPALGHLIEMVRNGQIEEDLTLANIGAMPDAYLKTDWEKARYVVENLACLLLADISAQWGVGYRSDDGYDYLMAALDNVRFLTDIDLDEESFLMWWNHSPEAEPTTVNGYYIDFGGSDGEIRYYIFPSRLAS